MYRVILGKQAIKDIEKLRQAGLLNNAKQLLYMLEQNPYVTPPPYEKLTGNLSGLYSRRINVQHRLIYEVTEAQKTVMVLRLWTHYE